MDTTRRSIIKTGIMTSGVALVGAGTILDQRPSAAASTPRTNPFTLGVASGDPLPDGFVIWTRLAPEPLAEDGLGGMPSARQIVSWQVATDERFRRVVRAGAARTGPELGHAVHVEVAGLASGTEYFFRFRLGRHLSTSGRTRTAPALHSTPAALSMAFASCSQFEHGLFTAYRRLAEDQPDLVLHLGDYQYEYRKGSYVAPGGNVRDHEGPETVSLAGYRQRLAQYKTDPDLQAAHAVAPWLVVFDDHEVDNNWADEIPENAASVPGFMDRRAAAFRAYYENMPLRRTSLPNGPDIQVYRRLQWGSLANFHMLDTRQYRDDQACGDGYDDCPEAAAPERSLPGAAQEQWLADGFRSSTQTWDVLGQQVFFGRRDSTITPDNTVSMDSWDGYPAARDRVVRSWVDAGVRNPIVLTGDVHAHWGSNVLTDWNDAASPVLGEEFVCSSITSGGNGYDQPTGRHPWAAQNPNLTFWTNLRGYVNTTITPESFTADFRCIPEVRSGEAAAFTRATFVIDSGVRGMRKVADNPLPTTLTRRAPRSDEQIIADTIEAETGH
ncbi:alkaline phosphatase D family protein [Nocardioides sp. InS609-2]|uniref:alkaline phosphatase D family protein n=1 Tax=Nocardioides sp. InS609-2 TaxID=2760705 RepID=UPI0020BFD189|nr:alkaline phosphatase D family protein [Nocardioides sp. InS609-2]